jgi:hypothetical protein
MQLRRLQRDRHRLELNERSLLSVDKGANRIISPSNLPFLRADVKGCDGGDALADVSRRVFQTRGERNELRSTEDVDGAGSAGEGSAAAVRSGRAASRQETRARLQFNAALQVLHVHWRALLELVRAVGLPAQLHGVVRLRAEIPAPLEVTENAIFGAAGEREIREGKAAGNWRGRPAPHLSLSTMAA